MWILRDNKGRNSVLIGTNRKMPSFYDQLRRVKASPCIRLRLHSAKCFEQVCAPHGQQNCIICKSCIGFGPEPLSNALRKYYIEYKQGISGEHNRIYPTSARIIN